MRYVLLLTALLGLTGCFGWLRPSKAILPPPPREAPAGPAAVKGSVDGPRPGETPNETELRQLRDYNSQLEAKIAETTGKIKTVEEAIADDDWAWGHSVCHWVVFFCLIGLVLDAGAAIYFRSKTLATLGVCLIGMAGIGMFSDWMLYHRKLAVGAIAIAGIITAIVLWLEGHGHKTASTEKSKLVDDAVEARDAALQELDALKKRLAG